MLVENVDETAEKAKAAGGKVLAGPFDMEDVGRMGIIADPQGAFLGIYQRFSEGSGSEGVFVWDELGTTDADGAQRFYEEVFGWTTTDMGSDFGGYRIFDRVGGTGQGHAGLMQNQNENIPAMWTPYVGVEDTDAVCAKAKELGANAIVEPMDVPTVGRFAVIRIRRARSSASSRESPPPRQPRQLLGGKSARVGRTALDPIGERRIAGDVRGGDTQPAAHAPPAHLHELRGSRGHQLVRLVRIDAHENPALAADADGHVASDEERKPAEHLLLVQAGLGAHQLADPSREFLVVGHRAMVIPLTGMPQSNSFVLPDPWALGFADLASKRSGSSSQLARWIAPKGDARHGLYDFH